MSTPLGYDAHGTPIYEGDIVVNLDLYVADLCKRLVVMDGNDDRDKVLAQDPAFERRLGYCSWVRCSSVLVDVEASPDRGQRRPNGGLPAHRSSSTIFRTKHLIKRLVKHG